ncbi:heterokaryon incompatibility protein-domain-containing protein [Schizothecium vesticola]|uniref:Heterokaryon incompatibility protein-domain-containing protein n=1 Tax=Schizothecium vesticola TaxID=314040 RepID=A0AA40F4D9_9PEZI|nr:heterokaryon incompatibility protein-domain-containing protein [Schizothecium vesticola]
MASSTMACPTCTLLSISLTQLELELLGSPPSNSSRDFDLGSIADLTDRAVHCDSCRSIVASIVATLPSTSTVTAHLSPSAFHFFLLIGNLLPTIHPSPPSSRRAHLHQLAHYPCYTTLRTTPTHPRGRLTPPTLNTPLIAHWLHRCTTSHAATCGTRQYDLHLLPTAHLTHIDTSLLCIVTPSSPVPYAALSYVWGTAPVLRALKSNVAALRRPGAFDRPEFSLPATIRDAVTLCARLGVRYLWVDSLCIVQDDPASQGEQLRAMGSVYGRAEFTIAALGSRDAGAGIARVGSPRGEGQREEVFSRRVLALEEGGGATWVCFGGQWTEDVEFASEVEGEEAAGGGFKLGPVTWPSIRAFADLAEEYATRDLTYASDTVNAFAGILTPMGQWFPGGLLFGVAEFTFDAGLLWDVRRSGAVMRSSGTPVDGGFPFPSWSWISWQGALKFNLWGEGEDYNFPRGPLTVKPLVRWQKRVVSTGAWVDVDNSYHRVRAHFDPAKEPAASIPTDWIKKVDEATHEAYYRNASHNHVVPHPRFSYPIPPFMRPRDMDRETYHPYIKFSGGYSKRLRISIPDPERARLSAKLEDNGATSEVDLVDDGGAWAGRVTLNLPKGGALPASDEPLELIAISESEVSLARAPHARFIFQEVTQRPELMGLDVYEVVNVLWIGWCGGSAGMAKMAYRKALGTVWKRAWVGADQVELLLT